MDDKDKRKQKYHIPMTIIDARSEKPHVLDDQPKQLHPVEVKSGDGDQLMPTIEMLLRRIGQQLQKLLIALKFRFFRMLDRFFEDMEIPWLKVIAVALVAFVLFKKNIQFNFSFNGPNSGIVDDQNYDTPHPQTATFGAGDANPYAPVAATSLRDKESLNFIRKYTDLARTEMKQFGIPASIKMAQALIESRAGKSKLARNNNNHFGIKCFSKKCKKGHCTNATDDHHKDFFRKYGEAKDSWRSHSNLLSQNRYKHLKSHGKDYKKWAHGLKAAGYATDKSYAQKLIRTIEKFELYKLDR